MSLLVIFYWILLLLIAIGAVGSPEWTWWPRANGIITADPVHHHRHQDFETDLVNYATILLIILILLLVGAVPHWPYSRAGVTTHRAAGFDSANRNHLSGWRL